MGGSQPCICIEMVQHKSSQDCQVNYRESHKTILDSKISHLSDSLYLGNPYWQ